MMNKRGIFVSDQQNVYLSLGALLDTNIFAPLVIHFNPLTLQVSLEGGQLFGFSSAFLLQFFSRKCFLSKMFP